VGRSGDRFIEVAGICVRHPEVIERCDEGWHEANRPLEGFDGFFVPPEVEICRAKVIVSLGQVWF
jgi:hypothetical protein